VVVGAFGVMFVMFGIINSFSPFFASLQETFTAQRGGRSRSFTRLPLRFISLSAWSAVRSQTVSGRAGLR
jgi:hypothetical protein